MSDTIPSQFPTLVALTVPAAFATAALLARRPDATAPLRRAVMASRVALGAWAVLAGLAVAGAGAVPGLVRLDAVTVVVLGLVCILAVVVVRYSRGYLEGEPGRARYARWLAATLAAVTLLVVADNLLLMAMAWVGTSIALHQLLTFYPDRPQALLAAHKKFLAARVAEACMLAAIALVWLEVGSLDLGRVHAWAGGLERLPAGVELASVLFVLAAAIKCAQLPLHGWLIQVMEAPTPISALLHAGVVNLGGFLMIRLAPVIALSQVAQTLLVAIGGITAVVAALVMSTRVSVKVALAWSTCAQMGFMLVQCGLGAYHLALLHLVAHSLYKAHAFLGSGSTVDTWRIRALGTPAAPARATAWLVAAAAGLTTVAAIGALFGASPAREPALWALAVVLGLATTPLLVRASGNGPLGAAAAVGGVAAMVGLYFAWHALALRLVEPPVATSGIWPRVAIVVALFVTLFAVHALLSARPRGRLARTLYPPLFAGLWLDETFTRVTFRLWPPRFPPRPDRDRSGFPETLSA